MQGNKDEKNTGEFERLVEEYRECNEIVRRVLDLGISQRQLIKIIDLLSLNIENIEKARKICAAIDSVTDKADKIVRDDDEEEKERSWA